MRSSRCLQRSLALTVGLLLIPFLVVAVARADLSVEEATLNPEGTAFEVNVGSRGDLWITDFGAGEIWRVNATSGAFVVYEGPGTPSDARPDGQGRVWWGEGSENTLGEMDLDTLAAQWWALPGASGVLGTAIDGAGRIWATAVDEPYLYRFDPDSFQLCTYQVPADGIPGYLASDPEAGVLWVATGVNERAYRIPVDGGGWTAWQLPADSGPVGLDVDATGRLWFADPNSPVRGFLASLDGDSNLLRTYELPVGTLPEMLAAVDDSIFYTEQTARSIGQLSVTGAAGVEISLSVETVAVTPICSAVTPLRTATAVKSEGTLAWSDEAYGELFQDDNWQIHALPAGAFPFGIAGDGTHIWFADQGRQILGRIDYATAVTVCLVEDEDGSNDTTDDRTPLSEWTTYLTVDAARQEPGRSTDNEGCATWQGLEPGHTYGVEQALQEGWDALNGNSHSFGVAAAGVSYTHTFVNTRTGTQLFLPLLRTP